jgi:hypothetical protein
VSHIAITASHTGLATIKLDGHDISAGIKAYELRQDAPHLPPVVLLTPAVFEVATADVEGKVYVAPAASDLLIRLGWTPPGGAA